MSDRKGLADLLEQRIERLTIRPGEMATYCHLDADLDRKCLAALRQEPSVDDLVKELRLAACGLFTLKNERGDYGYFDTLADRVQAIHAMYRRGEP